MKFSIYTHMPYAISIHATFKQFPRSITYQRYMGGYRRVGNQPEVEMTQQGYGEHWIISPIVFKISVG